MGHPGSARRTFSSRFLSEFRWIFHFDVLIKLRSGVNASDGDGDRWIQRITVLWQAKKLFEFLICGTGVPGVRGAHNWEIVFFGNSLQKMSGWGVLRVKRWNVNGWPMSSGCKRKRETHTHTDSHEAILLRHRWHLEHLSCIAISRVSRDVVCSMIIRDESVPVRRRSLQFLSFPFSLRFASFTFSAFLPFSSPLMCLCWFSLISRIRALHKPILNGTLEQRDKCPIVRATTTNTNNISERRWKKENRTQRRRRRGKEMVRDYSGAQANVLAHQQRTCGAGDGLARKIAKIQLNLCFSLSRAQTRCTWTMNRKMETERNVALVCHLLGHVCVLPCLRNTINNKTNICGPHRAHPFACARVLIKVKRWHTAAPSSIFCRAVLRWQQPTISYIRLPPSHPIRTPEHCAISRLCTCVGGHFYVCFAICSTASAVVIVWLMDDGWMWYFAHGKHRRQEAGGEQYAEFERIHSIQFTKYKCGPLNVGWQIRTSINLVSDALHMDHGFAPFAGMAFLDR